uniref:protein spire homolog 2-like n=1 Tax=Ictidomys tridecemlineatus TaxID=43179 RepID=UPI001A9F9D9C|nr:protein spire homolog 2-like [Ictidomys tridecemlineatus]
MDPGSCPVSVQYQPDPSSSQLSSLSSADRLEASAPDTRHLWLEFHHPVESLALTVEEVVGVRRVLVKAKMEKFTQDQELFSSLKRGKICCYCRAKFPLFSWPPTCLFCKRAVFTSCSTKMKMPSKKCAHIPVHTLGFESPQRAPAAKTARAPRRDVFQCVPWPGCWCLWWSGFCRDLGAGAGVGLTFVRMPPGGVVQMALEGWGGRVVRWKLSWGARTGCRLGHPPSLSPRGAGPQTPFWSFCVIIITEDKLQGGHRPEGLLAALFPPQPLEGGGDIGPNDLTSREKEKEEQK